MTKIIACDMVDTFRALHHETAALTHPTCRGSDTGNKLDYIFVSRQTVLTPVYSGIHVLSVDDIWRSDHHPVLVDLFPHHMRCNLGRSSLERDNRLCTAAFLRRHKNGDPRFLRDLEKEIQAMYFNEEEACRHNKAIEDAWDGDHTILEELVSEGAHLLAFATLELTRKVVGTYKNRDLSSSENVRDGLNTMIKACADFLTSVKKRAAASALREALSGWGGRGLEGVRGRDNSHRALGQELTRMLSHDQASQGDHPPTPEGLEQLVMDVKFKCSKGLASLDNTASHRTTAAKAAFDEGDTRRAFEILSGKDAEPLNSSTSLPATMDTTQEQYKESYDTSIAALRRDAVARPPSRLMIEEPSGFGNSTTHVPHPMLVQSIPPTDEQIEEATGIGPSDEDYPFVRIVVMQLREMGMYYKQTRVKDRMSRLVREASEEEKKTCYKMWKSKGKGVDDFNLHVMLCLPAAHQKLFNLVINVQLCRGMVLKSLQEAKLNMLPKKGGGERGVGLGHDLVKLPDAIHALRLRRIQLWFSRGTMTSNRNVAYRQSCGTEMAMQIVDAHAVYARVGQKILFMAEFDFYKYFDQMDRGWLTMLMVLMAFLAVFIAACSRRYEFQVLVSLTPWGFTLGVMRRLRGVDQGSSMSPFQSLVYQVPWLRTMEEWLKEMKLEFFLTAFADNVYLGVYLPMDRSILPRHIWNAISRTLRFCSIVVKETSVVARCIMPVGCAEYSEEERGVLVTLDFISGREVHVVPSRPTNDECPDMLGVPLSGGCEWYIAGQRRTKSVSFKLQCSLGQGKGLRFLDVQVRAGAISAAQYAALFASISYEQMEGMHKQWQACRRRELGFRHVSDVGIAMLPISLGGMGLLHMNLECTIIPFTRSLIAVLNQENDEETDMVLQFMGKADRQRFETLGGRTRVEVIMRRLAPYGIMVVDNHWHMVGRIMTRLQLEMQKVHGEPEYKITPLHGFPSDAQQRTHAMYAWGGPSAAS